MNAMVNLNQYWEDADLYLGNTHNDSLETLSSTYQALYPTFSKVETEIFPNLNQAIEICLNDDEILEKQFIDEFYEFFENYEELKKELFTDYHILTEDIELVIELVTEGIFISTQELHDQALEIISLKIPTEQPEPTLYNEPIGEQKQKNISFEQFLQELNEELEAA